MGKEINVFEKLSCWTTPTWSTLYSWSHSSPQSGKQGKDVAVAWTQDSLRWKHVILFPMLQPRVPALTSSPRWQAKGMIAALMEDLKNAGYVVHDPYNLQNSARQGGNEFREVKECPQCRTPVSSGAKIKTLVCLTAKPVCSVTRRVTGWSCKHMSGLAVQYGGSRPREGSHTSKPPCPTLAPARPVLPAI